MQHKVKLELTLVSVAPEGEHETKSVFEAQCHQEGAACLLRYDDPENGGHSEVVLSADICEIKRKGETSSRLVFIPNRLQDAIYITPHGPLPMSVYTHAVRLDSTPHGGSCRISYSLLLSGEHVGDNELFLTWRQV